MARNPNHSASGLLSNIRKPDWFGFRVLTVFGILFSDVDVNLQDVDGCTALHLASAEDLEGRCVEYLLTHKADALIKDNKVKPS
jgi:ankyrin repeat protein